MFTVKSLRAQTAPAARERHVTTVKEAHAHARTTSKIFHGVFVVASERGPLCYYAAGRKYTIDEFAKLNKQL